MSITYLHIILAFTGAVLFIVFQVLIRVSRTNTSGLQDFLRGHKDNHEPDHEYLVPLMAYEEDYPTFGRILELVLKSFPLQRFRRERDFEKALNFLHDSVFQASHSEDLAWAMSHIVSTFVRDPDVAFECRPHLEDLLDKFLKEVSLPHSESPARIMRNAD
ncbi:MAG: hypothetical protein V3R94_01960 [Acidobacteriota bacterium]